MSRVNTLARNRAAGAGRWPVPGPAALAGWSARRKRLGVKALVFRHNLVREAASTVGGRVDQRAFVSRFAPVRLEDVGELPLPADDWVRVKTTFRDCAAPMSSRSS